MVLHAQGSQPGTTPGAGTAARLAAFVVPIAALASAGAVVPHAHPGHGAVVSDISTVAGGLGGPAKATNVAIFPNCHLAFRAGYLYVADDRTVRRVSARTGWLTNLMGTGSVAPLGDGGPATKATSEPAALPSTTRATW